MKRELFEKLPEFEGRKEFIDEVMRINGEDIEKAKAKSKTAKEDVEKLQSELDEANSTIESLNSTITDLKESAENVDELKAKIKEFEEKEEKARIDKLEREKEEGLKARFDSVVSGEFVNEFTKQGAFSKFKEMLEDPTNKGKGDSEIYATLIKGNEGWLKQKQTLVNIAGMNTIDASLVDAEKFKAMTLAQQMTFANDHPKEYEELSKLI